MPFTRLTSPPLLVHDHNSNHGRRQSTSRSAGLPFSSRSPGPMAIPNTRCDLAPPPLPPPTDLVDLNAGSDPGWAWGNDPGGSFGKAGGPSSTPGSKFPKSWASDMGDNRLAQPSERPKYLQRESSTITIKSPTQIDSDRKLHDIARHQDEGYYSFSGPKLSAMSQQLHGEKHLQQRNTENSSQTYDNKLLSKLGKPKTPPRTSSIGSLENSPTSSLPFHMSGRHPNQLRSLSFPHSPQDTYSNSAYSETPPIKKEPRGFDESPQSRPISPSIGSSVANSQSFAHWRSPVLERSNTSNLADPDQHRHYPQRFPTSTNVLRQQKSRRSGSGSLLSSYDEFAGSMKNTASNIGEHSSPLKRESYEQSMFSETDSADSTFPMEDSVRHLHLEDRAPPSNYPDSSSHSHNNLKHSLHTSRSRPGMKRKQSQSPPPDLSHAANAQLLATAGMNTDPYRNTSQRPAQRLSPVHRFGPTQGSISSQSSAGFRTNSYASSAGLSVGGSSMTSLDQHSPGTISPPSEQASSHYQQHNGQDSPYVTSLPMNQGPGNTRSQPPQQYPQPSLDTPPDASIDQKPQTNASARRSNGPNMQSSSFICQCCPKKPKKYDTEQELLDHQAEKQYRCQYCNNRFKNKNEAERHQNSLHLRKHSWSCATLNGQYDNAFYPSTAIPPADNSPATQPPPPPITQVAAFDTCGYCGEQFSNDPQPDWDARATHLTNQHKFGECNQSKKFFRADHFRQHLKHSHGGTSGKWTNMLEAACMKDEPNPKSQENAQPHGAPVANMGMGQPMSPANVAQPGMGQSMGQQEMSAAHMMNMGPANIGHQPGLGQVNMSPQTMAQASMAQQAQQMAQIDMSNIDPNIGLQQMGSISAMGNMGSMGNPSGAPGPGQPMKWDRGQLRNERVEELPQEM